MASATRFLIERVNLNGNKLGGISNLQIDRNIELMLESGSSSLDPENQFIPRYAPLARFTTFDVKAFCDLAFAGGYVIPHVPISSNCDLYLQASSDGGTRGGAGTNEILRIAKGVVVPVRLTGTAPAAIECEVYADWNGSDNIVQLLTSQNLPGSTPSPAALWRIAALRNGSAGNVLHKMNSWTLNFGVTVLRQEQVNAPYPMDSAVTGFFPTLDFTTKDCGTILTASGFSGAVAASGGLLCYLAAYDTSTLFPSSTGAISFALAAGSPFYPMSIDAPGRDTPATVTYRCHGKGGDTISTPPIAYATGATVPAEGTTAATFVNGPVKDNTTLVEHRAFRIDLGEQWRVEGSQALPWPNNCFLVNRQPEMEITILDEAFWSGLGNAGRAISSGFHAYLRAMDADSEPTPDATANHVKISFTNGWIRPDRTGGGNRDSVEPVIRVAAKSGAVTLSIGSAIS